MHHEDPRLFRRRRKDGSLSPVWYGWFYDATGKQVCRSTKRTDRRVQHESAPDGSAPRLSRVTRPRATPYS